MIRAARYVTTVIEKCDCGYIFDWENMCYILVVCIIQWMSQKLKFCNYLNSLLYKEDLS